MTKTQVAQLLAYIRTFDNRTLDEAIVESWHDIIGYLDFNDCVAAVKQHFHDTTTEYLKPGHIVRHATARRNHRLAAQRQADEALKELAERAERGDRVEPRQTEDRSADVAELVKQVRSVLPEGDRKKLRWEDPTMRRYQPRAADEPNPEFRGWQSPPPVPGDEPA